MLCIAYCFGIRGWGLYFPGDTPTDSHPFQAVWVATCVIGLFLVLVGPFADASPEATRIQRTHTFFSINNAVLAIPAPYDCIHRQIPCCIYPYAYPMGITPLFAYAWIIHPTTAFEANMTPLAGPRQGICYPRHVIQSFSYLTLMCSAIMDVSQ